MKKGLLSLLAVALTVVGCQNYDDQFDELSDQITALSQTVQGLSTVADQITALQQTVNGLELTLGGDISDIKTKVEALETALADVATAADLGLISSTLAEVQADVKELLAANAVINQDITINNVATLEYVESLISTDPDDPNVIVNGEITIEVDDDDFDDEHLARILAVTNKFATGLKTVTINHTYSPTTVGPGPILTFDNLAFVDNDLSITGSTTIADGDTSNDKLRTVSGNLTIAAVDGDLDLSLLTSANDIVVPDDVTTLKMGSVKANSISTAGAVKGHLNLTKATIVDGGKSAVSSITAPKGTDIDITSAATLTVKCVVAATIDIEGTALTGDFSVQGTETTIVKALKVASINGSVTSNKVAQLHLPALTSVNTMSTDAIVMALDALESQGVSTTITAGQVLNFNAPKLVVSDIVSLTSATDATVKGHNSGALGSLIYGLKIKNLTIKELGVKDHFEVTTGASVLPALVNLNVKGATADAGPYITTQTNKVSITSGVLTDLTTSGSIDTVNMDGAAKLTTLSTGGFTRFFLLRGAAELTSATIGHDHIEGSDAATFVVDNAAKLTAIAPTELDEVGTVTLTTLPKLTSLDLSSMVTLPQLGSYNICISATALSGSYLIATEITTTTQVFADKIMSNDLLTLKPYMDASAASGLVTFSLNGDILSSTTTKTYNSAGEVGATSTNTETLIHNIYREATNTSKVASLPFVDSMFSQVVAE